MLKVGRRNHIHTFVDFFVGHVNETLGSMKHTCSWSILEATSVLHQTRYTDPDNVTIRHCM